MSCKAYCRLEACEHAHMYLPALLNTGPDSSLRDRHEARHNYVWCPNPSVFHTWPEAVFLCPLCVLRLLGRLGGATAVLIELTVS